MPNRFNVALKDVDGNILLPQTDAAIVTVNDALGAPSNVEDELKSLRETLGEIRRS